MIPILTRVGITAKRTLRAVGASLAKAFDPVEQDSEWKAYVTYRGTLVRVRPIADPARPGWVAAWEPDPPECDAIDASLGGTENRSPVTVTSVPLDVRSALIAPFRAMRRAWSDSQDDVDQMANAFLFDTYRGREVRLRPVMDLATPGRVEAWIPDPDEVREIDAAIAAPGTATTGGTPQPPPLPTAGTVGGFNPAEIPGL